MIAAVAGIWFVLAGLLGMRHEARVAHVFDPHTGELRHAHAMVGHHAGDHSDYHGTSDPGSDDDTCAIATALHQSVCVGSAPSIVSASCVELGSVQVRPVVSTIVVSVYRLAPKTSPPTLV
ncbi:MAG TPA: hypothetical protein VGG74_05540 [Kofleriaceae bacterium]